MNKKPQIPTYYEFISRDVLGSSGVWFPAAVWLFAGIIGGWWLLGGHRRHDASDEQLAPLVLGIVCGAVVLSILSVTYSWRRYTWICRVLETGERVPGKIIAVEPETRYRRRILYFEYSYQGVTHSAYQRSRDEVPIPPWDITVAVNPDDPTDAYIEDVLVY